MVKTFIWLIIKKFTVPICLESPFVDILYRNPKNILKTLNAKISLCQHISKKKIFF